MNEGSLLVYGATGYSGELVAREARRRNLPLIVAGRDPGKVAALAQELGAVGKVLAIGDVEAWKSALSDVSCVVNAAGPFWNTAQFITQICIETRTHYIDITGELNVFLMARKLDASALDAGVMILPGAGYDVVPSDCLAAHVVSRSPSPLRLDLALRHVGLIPTRGSLRSMVGIMEDGLKSLRNGKLVEIVSPPPREFDFGYGPEEYYPYPMGELITCHTSTGVPNIAVHFASAYPDELPNEEAIALLPAGASESELVGSRSEVLAEVEDADGQIFRSKIESINGYAYTGLAAAEVASRVLAGNFRPGYQTPATAYGFALATSIGEGKIVDLN